MNRLCTLKSDYGISHSLVAGGGGAGAPRLTQKTPFAKEYFHEIYTTY